MPRPETHYFHVEMRLRGLSTDSVDLVLPAWTPGSYKIRDYARHLQEFSAGGRRWEKIDKSRWRVRTGGKRELRVRYRVWAHDLTVRTSHLDAEHGYLNGGNIFLYLDGAKEAPLSVRVVPHRGWRVATGLEEKSKHRYVAPDYDTLVDSPMEIGRFRESTFRSRGKRHRIVIDGGGNYDETRIVRDAQKIVETASKMMGDMPYRDYTFILHTLPDLRGGLEHRNSSCIQYPDFAFREKESYNRFLALLAHEYFHTWNVKRIRPEQFGPFDYEKEVYTTLLWVMEGVTCHYEILIPTRAKLYSPEDYLEILSRRISRHLSLPGRHHQSLEEASFNAWIMLYQPSNNAINSQVNYYEKGPLVALLLDLEIRQKTKNRKSLDDVMRALYREYGGRGVGFPEPEFRATCERIAGGSFAGFFRDYVQGTREISWNRFLDHAGLQLKERPPKGKEENDRTAQAWTGIIPAPRGERLFLKSVLAGSPAEKAGLSPDDEIVALDGARITAANWTDRIEDCRPGQALEVVSFRMGFLRTKTLALKKRPDLFREIRRKKNPTALQKRIYRGLTGS
jgi:predicted metalloprotease with PDZ domain